MSVFIFFISGCSNGIEPEGGEILVQKRIGEENKYEDFRSITNNRTVQQAKDIIEKSRWENAEVSMAYPPHYKFQFKGEKEQSTQIYDLWISPNNDKVELVIEGGGKYIQLSKVKSAKLFEIISGEELSEIE